MQLRRQVPGNKTVGPIDTAVRIIKREGFMSLYKGLSAVYTGIVPKMVRTEDSWQPFNHDFPSGCFTSIYFNSKQQIMHLLLNLS